MESRGISTAEDSFFRGISRKTSSVDSSKQVFFFPSCNVFSEENFLRPILHHSTTKNKQSTTQNSYVPYLTNITLKQSTSTTSTDKNRTAQAPERRKGSSSFYILCNGRNSKVVYNAEQQFDEDGKLSLSFEKLCLVLITTIQTCYE